MCQPDKSYQLCYFLPREVCERSVARCHLVKGDVLLGHEEDSEDKREKKRTTLSTADVTGILHHSSSAWPTRGGPDWTLFLLTSLRLVITC